MGASTYLTRCLLPWQHLPSDSNLSGGAWGLDLGDRREGDLARLYLFRSPSGLWDWQIWFTDPSPYATDKGGPFLFADEAEESLMRALAAGLHSCAWRDATS